MGRSWPWRVVQWALALSLACACGDSGAGSPDAALPDAGLSAVTGSVIHRAHTDAPEAVESPVDLTDAPVIAWVPRGDGTFVEIGGTGLSDGSFSIQNVPEQPVYIQVGTTICHTAARQLDLGRDNSGRDDWEFTAEGTTLQIDADGLRPWESLDGIAMLSSNMGLWLSFIASSATTPIPTGTGSLSGIDFAFEPPRVDAAAGDRVSLYQLDTAEVSGTTYTSIVRELDVEPTSFTDGVTTVSGTFEPVAGTETFQLDWGVPAWRSHSETAHPEALASLGELRLLAQDVPTRDGLYGPELVSLLELSAARLPLPYRDPFDPSWTRYVHASVLYGVEHEPPGADQAEFVIGDMIAAIELSEYDIGPLLVQVSPPRRPRIDGFGSYADSEGTGATPKLIWAEPTIGTPTGYRIEIQRYERFGTIGLFLTTAELFTTATEVEIPPGILLEGVPHVFVIYAVRRPNLELLEAPHRASLPLAETPAFSGLVIP